MPLLLYTPSGWRWAFYHMNWQGRCPAVVNQYNSTIMKEGVVVYRQNWVASINPSYKEGYRNYPEVSEVPCRLGCTSKSIFANTASSTDSMQPHAIKQNPQDKNDTFWSNDLINPEDKQSANLILNILKVHLWKIMLKEYLFSHENGFLLCTQSLVIFRG